MYSHCLSSDIQQQLDDLVAIDTALQIDVTNLQTNASTLQADIIDLIMFLKQLKLKSMISLLSMIHKQSTLQSFEMTLMN